MRPPAPPAPPSPFRFCPSCGAGGGGEGGTVAPDFLEGKLWRCSFCGFEYFHNVATAAGVIVEKSGYIVLIERAKEPRKGALGLPGGFVEPGERAEDAALRECREEIGWAPPRLDFLGSYPNSYDYGGVTYNTCDLFFFYRLEAAQAWPELRPTDGEALSISVTKLSTINAATLAFPSLGMAVESFGNVLKIDRRLGADREPRGE